VHDAMLVRLGQPLRDLQGEVDDLWRGDRLALDALLEALPR